MPMNHPYQLAFRKGLQKVADLHDIQLEVYDTDWDTDSQEHLYGSGYQKGSRPDYPYESQALLLPGGL